MNIEDNFNSAEVYLEMAKEKISRQDYVGALASLSQAYSHTHSLLDQVFKLRGLQLYAESSVEDVSP